ncbi:MAG: sugar transferase [Acidobacteria bacterium]|nr:sugar transferase [Acidobacteriota bacterium]
MIQQRAKIYTILSYAMDSAWMIAALPLAYYSRLVFNDLVPVEVAAHLNPSLYPLPRYFWLLALFLPGWTLVSWTLGIYRSLPKVPLVRQTLRIARGELILGFLVGFALFFLKQDPSRLLLLLWIFFHFLLVVGSRCLFGFAINLRWKNGWNYRSILIVGSDERAREIGRVLEKYETWGYKVLGYVSANGAAGGEKRVPVLGHIQDLPEIMEDHPIDEILFIGSSRRDLESFDEVFRLSEELGIKTRLVATFFPQSISRISLDFLDQWPLITFSSAPDHEVALLVKRILDVVLSALLLLILAPWMLLIAALIKLTSDGPVLYRQVRLGLYGRKFVLYKFRSMVAGAEDILWEIKHLNEMAGPVFKMRNDPRVTPFGRFLRKSSLDELPQFYNVLKGEMSLVGPRAPLPEEVREYTRKQRRRLSVKPGITCLWQVSGRNEIDFNEWMALDLNYIDHWCLALDLKILLKTLPVVVLGKGAR